MKMIKGDEPEFKKKYAIVAMAVILSLIFLFGNIFILMFAFESEKDINKIEQTRDALLIQNSNLLNSKKALEKIIEAKKNVAHSVSLEQKEEEQSQKAAQPIEEKPVVKKTKKTPVRTRAS